MESREVARSFPQRSVSDLQIEGCKGQLDRQIKVISPMYIILYATIFTKVEKTILRKRWDLIWLSFLSAAFEPQVLKEGNT